MMLDQLQRWTKMAKQALHSMTFRGQDIIAYTVKWQKQLSLNIFQLVDLGASVRYTRLVAPGPL